MGVACINTCSQPTNPYAASSSTSPSAASALPREPYDSRDKRKRADHEPWLLFVNRLDIAFRPRDEGPRDGAHCCQPVPVAALQGVARRANAGAASLQLKHHTSHLALCKWQRYGTGCEQTKAGPGCCPIPARRAHGDESRPKAKHHMYIRRQASLLSVSGD